MFLFIFESIGTSELILVGIIALIFLGPRKLPDIARKIGSMMAEFRGTANEFKETWQREVDFEEEAKAFDLTAPGTDTVIRSDAPAIDAGDEAPAVREVDPSALEHLLPEAEREAAAGPTVSDPNEKQNWL
jgi:sec-independent protein translocase protein TatB